MNHVLHIVFTVFALQGLSFRVANCNAVPGKLFPVPVRLSCSMLVYFEVMVNTCHDSIGCCMGLFVALISWNAVHLHPRRPQPQSSSSTARQWGESCKRLALSMWLNVFYSLCTTYSMYIQVTVVVFLHVWLMFI